LDNLRGIVARDWARLLRQNRFAVDRVYWRRAAAVTMISIRNTRLKRQEDQRCGAELERAQAQPPVFILGHWRSGTTLLHELLILDPQFGYPNVFEVANPHTFLTLGEVVEREMADAPPQTRPMDNMQITFRSPGEDEAALSVMSLRSPMIGWAFPRREDHYDRYYTFRGVPQPEIDEWKAALVGFLKKLALKYDRPMVLKSPAHTGRIRLLLELFPDARFIHIHRDPYTVFRSTQNLYAKAVPFSYLQRPDPARIDDGIIRRYEMMYDAFFAERGLIPAGQYCEVGFEDLERDIVGQVGMVYEQLGLRGFDALRPQLQQYAASKTGYQKNKHQPLAEPLREKIARSWRSCFDAWGYAA
jgi:omega-hydroxy-beta-dihydromenaquinone-9 sulfotransferase